ncbi:hypothetical protein A6770_25670 [Nostoc minutum NIES-26]|uniref:Addiction module protein n=1 Tax=Nostoc minutum NIES-26 TaxID=1844469 RepID=A0A367QWE5_9NOSO|nr:hypothetical protein A6770_25670 [Nostoc minutum NIES-26]
MLIWLLFLDSNYNLDHDQLVDIKLMSLPEPLALPTGFEQLSKDQQIDYVQQLWDLILAVPENVPAPKWHLEIVRERVSSQVSAQLTTWSEAKQRLQSKYREQ